MQELPHLYKVKVNGSPTNNVKVFAENLPPLEVAPPKGFDGPGDQWSPEELLMASVANCLVLSFRAIAKASNFDWLSIECESQGELNKVDKKILFTKIFTQARLVISSGGDENKAERLLNRAEQTCFISNSLSAESHFECEIVIDNG